jgi:hypothetical protein
VTCLGVISGATAYRPPLPPCRAGNEFHSNLGQFKMGLGWLVNACSLAILFTCVCVCVWVGGGGWFKPTKPRGSLMGMQGVDDSTTKPCGIMKVGMLGLI